MQFRATVCIRRHNRAATANTGGGCFDFRASIFRACTLFPWRTYFRHDGLMADHAGWFYARRLRVRGFRDV